MATGAAQARKAAAAATAAAAAGVSATVTTHCGAGVSLEAKTSSCTGAAPVSAADAGSKLEAIQAALRAIKARHTEQDGFHGAPGCGSRTAPQPSASSASQDPGTTAGDAKARKKRRRPSSS